MKVANLAVLIDNLIPLFSVNQFLYCFGISIWSRSILRVIIMKEFITLSAEFVLIDSDVTSHCWWKANVLLIWIGIDILCCDFLSLFVHLDVVISKYNSVMLRILHVVESQESNINSSPHRAPLSYCSKPSKNAIQGSWFNLIASALFSSSWHRPLAMFFSILRLSRKAFIVGWYATGILYLVLELGCGISMKGQMNTV